MGLIAELKRRKVFKVGAAYLVVAWLAVQAASIGFPAFDAPAWALRVFILVTLLGFPLALVLAWAIDIGPEGIRLEMAPVGNKRIATIAAILVAIAIGWYFFNRPRAPGTDAHSIAVLPFVNMSADPAQEYFSDGIAEELLNRLAQSVDLHVAARTSAFQFKGKNLDIADIARQLRVANVLEGSVRRDGARIRVTAQLIEAASGFHLWSQTFERDAADVFKVQDEISAAISSALEAKLGARSAVAARNERQIDPAAYDDYLQGRRHTALRVGDNLHLAADDFTRAIARAPDYAPAYSARAFATIVGLGWKPWMTPDAALAAADADVAQTLRIDPDAAEAFMVRGIAQSLRLHTNAALADFERALKLAPGNVDVLNFSGDFLQMVAALRRAESLKRQAMALDPLAFVHPMNLNQILDDQGRYAEAVVMGERAMALNANGIAAEQLFYAKLRVGDLAGARSALEKACADYGEEDSSCRLDRALLLARTGKPDEARAIVEQAAEVPTPAWGGVPPHAQAAAVLAFGLGDYAGAAAHVKASFDAIVWFPTLALSWSDGGAKLPEEVSRDPQWLEAWSDPRAREVMALYRSNVAAFRRGE